VDIEKELTAMMIIPRSVRTLFGSSSHRATCPLRLASLLLAVFGLVFCAVASAQTAHLIGTQSTIASGAHAQGIAVDGSGNLFIADMNNNRVLEMLWNGSSYGAPQVVVSGLGGPQGIAVDGSGNLYISDTNNRQVLKETLSGGVYTPSVVASNSSGGISGPVGVAVDVSGNVYIADYATSKIYKETLTGGTYVQSTIGSGFFHPTGVAVDGVGNVYIAGYNSGQAYKETLSGGTYSQSTIGSGMVDPTGIAVDGSHNVYITDVVLGTVVEEPWTGSGYGAQITLASSQSGPYGIAVDRNGNILIANGNSKVVDLSSSAGNFGAVNVGSASSSAIVLTFLLDTSGTIQDPLALTQGAAGLDFAVTGGSCVAGTYVAPHTCTVNVTFTPKFAGSRNGAVVLKNSSGNVIATGYIYGSGIGPQVNFLPGTQKIVADSSSSFGLSDPEWAAVDASGNVYITDAVNNRVVKETLSGGSYTQSVISSDLAYPHGVAVDGAGNVFIADTNHGRVVEVPWTGSAYGTEITLPTSPISGTGLAVDGSGNVYIADLWQSQVFKESPASGSYTESVVTTGLSNPNGLGVDGNGNVYIANYGTNQVLEVPWTSSGYGAQTAIVSNLNYLQGLAVDGSGNLYVADWDSDGTVYKETLTGGSFTQSTIVSFPAVFMPRAMAVDGSGNVYWNNGVQVVKLDAADAPSLSFATTNVGGSSNDSPQTVTVGNIGNALLTFTALNYPTDFTGTGDCSATTQLAAGADCSLAISFNPLSADNLNEAVQLADNSLNVVSTQNILLSGIGTTPPPPPQTVPTIVWTLTSNVNYGSDLSTVLNALATDGGGNPVAGTFSYTATPAGGSAVPVTSATILAPGSYLLSASFTPNDQITYTSATASAPLTVNPRFLPVNIGSPSPTAMTATFVIPSGLPGSGTLGSPLVLTQGATGLDFTDATTGSCASGMSYSSGITCTVNVTFTPKYAGMRYGAVVLADSLGTILATNYISGTGLGPQVNFLPATQIKLGGGFGNPFGAAVDGNGNLIVADPSNGAVKMIPPTCVTAACVTTLGGGFTQPYGVAVDGSGNIFVADWGNNAVDEIPFGCMSAACVVPLGSGFNGPEGIAVDGSGNVFVSSWGDNSVKEILAAGGYTNVQTLGSGFTIPLGVAVDASGNVFVADLGNNAVKEILASGGYTTVIPLGSGFSGPEGVAVDGNGNIFVADSGNWAIKEIVASGGYTTVQTLGAGFAYPPTGVAVDGRGNVFFPDASNSGAVELDLADAPSVRFATTAVGFTDQTHGVVTVENIGNMALSFSAVTYPTDFPEAAGNNDCSTGLPLAAGTSCPLTISFSPTVSGSLNETVALADNSLYGASAQGITVSGVGLEGAQSITFSSPGNQTYGGAPITLNGTASSALPVSYSVISGPANVNLATLTITGAGVVSIQATQSGNGSYAPAVPVTVSFTVNKATPAITTLPTAGAITFGQTLASSTLSGGTGSTAGSFAFTSPATAPGAGTAPQSVVFNPSDSADYNTAIGSVNVTVNKAIPTITTLPSASTITYGQTLASSTLSGGAGSTAGSFTFTTPATTPGAGTPSESVTFTPTDLTDYAPATGSISITVNKATSTVTTLPTASPITFGQMLAASTLSGGAGSTAGSFTFASPTLAPGAGTATQGVIFTPTDLADYSTASGSVSVTVNKATPTITTLPTASTITYGQTLSSSTLSGGAGSTAGSFAFTNPTTVPGAGTASESVTFTPNDLTDFTTATGSISVTVNKANSTITTLPTASPIIYGQTLASSTLTGGSATPGGGTFTFTAPTTAPGAGTASQSVTYTPTDTTDYNTVTSSVSVVLNKANTTITIPPTASPITYGQPLAASNLSGGAGSTAGSFAFTTPGKMPHGGTASQSVTFTPSDTADYNTVTGPVGVTVNKATPNVVWPTPASVTFGTALGSTQLNATAVGSILGAVAGTYVYTPAAGTIPATGTDMLSVTFIPTDETDYTTATQTVSLTVTQATAVVTLGSLTQTYSGAPEPVTVSTSPTGLFLTFSYTGVNGTIYPSTATPPTNPGSYSVAASVVDPNYIGQDIETLTIRQLSPALSFTLMSGAPAPTPYGTMVYFELGMASMPVCPTGIVQLYVDGNASGSPVVLNGAGPCVQPVQLQTAMMPQGPHNIFATYTGDAYYSGATSVTLPYTVTQDTTSVTLATSGMSANVGQPLTFTATVTPSSLDASALPPTGYVQFMDRGVQIGSNVALAGTTAIYNTSALAFGPHNISATFVDSDGNFVGNSSAVTVETVNLIVPTINFAPAPTEFVYGTPLDASKQLNATAIDPTSNLAVPGSFAYNFAANAVVPVGTPNLIATFTPADPNTYAGNSATVSITVDPAVLTVTPDNLSILYGAAIPTLTYQIAGYVNGDPSTVVSGTASCTTSATAGSTVAGYPITCTQGTGGLSANNYSFQFVSGTLTVTQATPTITTLPAASTITYGQTLGSSTLAGGAGSTAGTFAFTTPAAAPAAGSTAQSVTFTPADTIDYTTVTGSVSVTVSKATPTITTPPTASTIIYGQTLGSSTLAGGAGSVPGSFSFTNPATSPGAGTASASVTFAPTDAANYNTATGSISLTINKAASAITMLPTPSSISYGQTLAASTLTGGAASTPGSFAFVSPSLAPGVGMAAQSITFRPTDAADYSSVSGLVNVTVNKAVPTITTLPTATTITYGQTLASSTLTGGAGSTAGSFSFTTPATVPGAGAASQGVTFTPTDLADYTTATGSISVTVNKAASTITTLPTASTITYGQTLAASTLTGGVSSTPGSFSFTNPATAPGAGTAQQSVIFTPADLADYTSATGSISVTVNKASASVTPNAGTKIYGSVDPGFNGTLTGFVAGDNVTATYSRASGETVGGGPYAISANLSPSAILANYNVTYNTANFSISKAALTATANNASMSYDGALPTLTGTLTGVIAGDAITSSFITTATAASPAGTYPITPQLSDPGNKLSNYATVLVNGTLTVSTDATTTTLQSSAPIILTQSNVTFTAKVTSSAGTPAGQVSFMDGSVGLGTITLDNTGTATLTTATLSVGPHTITAVYAGNVDYVGSTSGAVTETVQDFSFSINGSTTTVLSATVLPGNSAVYTLQLSPTSGSVFASAVVLTLTGMPAGASYTISPSTIPAGSGAVTVTITVNTAKSQASATAPNGPSGFPKPLLLAVLLPMFGMRKMRRALRLQMLPSMLILLGVLMATGMSACGGGTSLPAPQTSAMTLTATSGAVHHSVTLDLTIQ